MIVRFLIHLRRIIFVAALISAAVCIVLLLNITAPNPTGRRYSSQPIDLTLRDSQRIGEQGESILSIDLHLLHNAEPNLQCLCDSRNPNQKTPPCRACIVDMTLVNPGGYREPDFVGNGFIAESKNQKKFLYSRGDDIQQITDYVNAALALRQPFYLYVRVDTPVGKAFYPLVESTGGAIIPYFAVPGWIDPVDEVARRGLLISGGTLSLVGLSLLLGRRDPRPVTARIPVIVDRPSQPQLPSPIMKANRDIDAMERFHEQSVLKTWRKLDGEAAHEDLIDL